MLETTNHGSGWKHKWETFGNLYRMCVILEDEGKQAELNNEIENLMKRPEFDLYFTSHETIPHEQLDALPTG